MGFTPALSVLQLERKMLTRISIVLFPVVGVIWIAATFSSRELVLLWPAIAFILSGISLLVGAARQVRRPLGVASSLFGLVIALFQLSLSTSLIGTALGGLAAYSVVIFGLLMVLQTVLLYAATKT